MKKFRQKRRSMGQVFLTEQWPIDRTVQILKKWQVQRVLEIGPGPGGLTRALLQAGARHVIAIERAV